MPDPTAREVCERGATASAPECGGARRRAHRRGPRSCHRAPTRPRAGSMRSWSNCARNQAKKAAAPAITTVYTERGRRRPRRRAGAGATVLVKVKEWWVGDAYHPETEKTSLPARKKLRWQGSATAVNSGRRSGRRGRSSGRRRGREPAAREAQRAPDATPERKKGRR
jgi:hypothetical protein